MLLPWKALSGLGCGAGCPCAPCSGGLGALGTTIPPGSIQRPKYAGQNFGESDDAFFARMRASQAANARGPVTQAPTRAPLTTAPRGGGISTTPGGGRMSPTTGRTVPQDGRLMPGSNTRRVEVESEPIDAEEIKRQIQERQQQRLTPEQLSQLAQGAGSIGAGAVPGEEGGSFLTSAGFLLPVAVGGAGAAAGSLLYHSPDSIDRERSSKTIKRKELQSTATAAVGGAASGAAIGTMIAPGIGTIIGGLVGGGAGAVAGLLNGKKLKKRNKKLAQQAAFEAASEQQRLDAARQAAIDEQREYQAALTEARLDMEAKVREANRWAIAVRQLRGDEASARLLLNEVGALRAALHGEQDLDTAELLVDQATESVEDMRSLAEAAEDAARPAGRAGLSGLDVDDYVLEARRQNRAALGLPPQSDPGLSTNAKIALGVGALGLAQWLYWRSRR